MNVHLVVDVANRLELKMSNNNWIFSDITDTISSLDLESIDESRRKILSKLIDYFQIKIDQKEQIKLIFVCTHNSRRSHLAQIWAHTMSHLFKLKQISCFSAGTEETALYPAVIKTLKNQGFQIDKEGDQNNPNYHITFSEKEPPTIAFSKKISHPSNPSTNFIAIMTCAEADHDCPIIVGADKRFALTYDDPKTFDHLPIQLEKYHERSLQIATEMYFVFSQLKS